MQTFITGGGDSHGVANLDSKRLNKQLLEGRQILNVLVTIQKDPAAKVAWRNHPAVKMWAGYEFALYSYLLWVETECRKREIQTEKNMAAIVDLAMELDGSSLGRVPAWWTDPVRKDRIITSHRASLYKKDPDYYAEWKFESDWVDAHRYAVVCCDRCNYYWPTHKEA